MVNYEEKMTRRDWQEVIIVTPLFCVGVTIYVALFIPYAGLYTVKRYLRSMGK